MLLLLVVGVAVSAHRNFRPDGTFEGSTLTGWTAVGGAEWTAATGVITARAGTTGGWLLLNESWQDVQFGASFRCTGDCRVGVIVRAEKTARGWKGVYAELPTGPMAAAAFAIELDEGGRETTRRPLGPAGGTVRIMPPPAPGVTPSLAITAPPPVPPGSPYVRRDFSYQAGEWNDLEVLIDANILRVWINDGPGSGATNGLATDDVGRYGPVGLHVAAGEVQFRQVAWKDLSRRVLRADRVSSRFRLQRLDDFYYGWSAAAADLDRDGALDVIAGPRYYLGPDYEVSREFALGLPFNPGTQYPAAMVTFAFDYTNDGWPDILAAESRPLALYVNPSGQRRRWDRHLVVPDAISEINVFKDIDGDARPDAVYTGKTGIAWASPDPNNPTAPWTVHPVSGPAFSTEATHGLGAGDINGDGRMDIVSAHGWFEQPAGGRPASAWLYHPVEFGRWPRMSSSPGGGDMGVYDVNGDGLPDVVTSLEAHAWGLAWFEQTRTSNGGIGFVRHMIADHLDAANAGGVTFSEPHATAVADVDGDGILDLIVGKRAYAHSESYYDPDPYGDAVLYWYRTVRTPRAPGGAEFVPELIHNRSGAGSTIGVADLNGDGAVDVMTSTTRGTFVFWNTPARR